MVKTRGLDRVVEKLDDITKVISGLLKEQKNVTVFECGCGYGKAMLELTKMFGNNISISGMNLYQIDGTKKTMLELAKTENLLSKKDLKNIKLPKIIYGDAGEELPFKNGAVDVIYSITAAYLFENKLKFLEEAARVLSCDGVAWITDPFSERMGEGYEGVPLELKKLTRIYEKGKEIDIYDFLKRFKEISVKKNAQGKQFIEVRSGKLDFDVRLISTIDLKDLNGEWRGVQSIYVVNE